MTAQLNRAPTYLQPRFKAPATSNLSSYYADSTPALPSQPPGLPSRLSRRQSATDPLSDRITSSLIRRTLCSQTADKSTPVLDVLPPLTSSNEVDLQLYALIAIVLRDFVQAWYSKITPDQVFVEEIVRIIAHCTRGLEQRLRKVDLEALIFDELPELLDAHVRAYRTAFYANQPGPVEADSRVIYHALWPTPALSPVPIEEDAATTLAQKENEAAYRQLLVQGVLAILLPTEDLENTCLTSLVGQIFSELIIGNGLGGKACEPWLLWEAFTKIADLIKLKMPDSKAQERAEMSQLSGQLEEDAGPERSGNVRRFQWSWSPQKTFWLVLQYAFWAFTSMRFVIITIADSGKLPTRSENIPKIRRVEPVESDDQYGNSPGRSYGDFVSAKRSILTMKIWSCASNLLDLYERMPWLCASISGLRWITLRGPGKIGATNGMVDKLLSHAISLHVLDAKLIPVVLQATRAALFPNNAPGPARLVPDADEQLRIKRRCAEAILALVPPPIRRIYFGTSPVSDDSGGVGAGMERVLREVEEGLDVFGDSYANKHLIYGLVELIIVRLMPELAEKGITELMDERLS